MTIQEILALEFSNINEIPKKLKIQLEKHIKDEQLDVFGQHLLSEYIHKSKNEIDISTSIKFILENNLINKNELFNMNDNDIRRYIHKNYHILDNQHLVRKDQIFKL